jgi:peroxiredoxin Q/BCP
MDPSKMKKTILFFLLILNNFYVSAEDWLGKSAPNFDLPDQNGVFHTLNEYKGKWLIVYFYPKDDTPGCTTEAKNFTEDYNEITQLGAVIIGVSMDDIESHKEFSEKYNIPFTLLADKDGIMSEDYSVISRLPLFNHAKRQTFIINPDGIISKHYEEVTPDTHSEDVIESLKELI